MRSIAALVFAAVLASPAAYAQKLRPIQRETPNQPKKVLSGEEKVRFLLSGLDLSSEQREHATGLFAVYFGNDPGETIDLAKVQQLVKEIEEAKKAGDTAREQEIQEELRRMGQKADPTEEFLANMMTVLTDEQKARLRRAQERLVRNPSGEFQAVDVLRAALECKPTPEQYRALEALYAEFRHKNNRGRGPREDRQARLLDQLESDVRAILTEQQHAAFDGYLAICRP